MIVTQADTEPASVEQQRWLAETAPSLYDARNLFQVNVEEGRHLWAMVYLLQAYFESDGREEADMLLERCSGDEDKPRILDAFNQPCSDCHIFQFHNIYRSRWKISAVALAESAFDPLSRTCRFMLTEEAHHLFVDKQRVLRRSVQLFQTRSKWRCYSLRWYRFGDHSKICQLLVCLFFDLFGSEISTNAADFASGLKGRYQEAKKYTEHTALNQSKRLSTIENGVLTEKEISAKCYE